MKFLNGVMIIQLLQKKNMMPKLKKLKQYLIQLCKKYINKQEEPQEECLTLEVLDLQVVPQVQVQVHKQVQKEQLQEELKMLNKLNLLNI